MLIELLPAKIRVALGLVQIGAGVFLGVTAGLMWVADRYGRRHR